MNELLLIKSIGRIFVLSIGIFQLDQVASERVVEVRNKRDFHHHCCTRGQRILWRKGIGRIDTSSVHLSRTSVSSIFDDLLFWNNRQTLRVPKRQMDIPRKGTLVFRATFTYFVRSHYDRKSELWKSLSRTGCRGSGDCLSPQLSS